MKQPWKDWRFWVCALLFVGLLWLTGRFEHWDASYHPFPYIMAFHALTLFAWLSGLYHRWSGTWKTGDGRTWGGWVLLCAAPQLPMCGVSFVSWGLLGVSLLIGVTAILWNR